MAVRIYGIVESNGKPQTNGLTGQFQYYMQDATGRSQGRGVTGVDA